MKFDFYQFWGKYGSKILTGLAVSGIAATGVLSAIGAVKSTDNLRKAHAEQGEKLDTKTIIKEGVLPYAPAVATGVATIACVIGAHITDQKQIARVTAAYGLMRETFDIYRQKTKEIAGEEKEKEIERAVAEEQASRHYAKAFTDTEQHQFYINCPGLDHGYYFTSTYKDVIVAEVMINNYFMYNGAVSVRDAVLEFIPSMNDDDGQSLCTLPANVGWTEYAGAFRWGYDKIEFEHHEALIDDGTMQVTEIVITTPVCWIEEC